MALRGLVLCDVVDRHPQAAVDAAVVQVEAEPTDFQRLAAAFMLPGVDARVEQVKDLIIAGKKRFVEDFGVAHVDARAQGRCRNRDAFMQRLEQIGGSVLLSRRLRGQL